MKAIHLLYSDLLLLKCAVKLFSEKSAVMRADL